MKAPLKTARISYDLQPRTIVATVRDLATGEVITDAQGTTYGDSYVLAKARAFALGYEIVVD